MFLVETFYLPSSMEKWNFVALTDHSVPFWEIETEKYYCCLDSRNTKTCIQKRNVDNYLKIHYNGINVIRIERSNYIIKYGNTRRNY